MSLGDSKTESMDKWGDVFKGLTGIESKVETEINVLRDFLCRDLVSCMKVVGALSGSIFLLDEDKEELVLAISKNNRDVCLEGVRTKLGERVSGKVAVERKPLLVKNVDYEEYLKCLPRYTHYSSKSFLCVPLEFSGNLLGVVNITDKFTGKVFDNEDLHNVLSVLRYSGVSIASVRNYLDKQRRVVETLANRVDELTREVNDLKQGAKSSEKFSTLGKLVGSFVHEINSPLDGIIRYVNLSLESLEDKILARKYLLETKSGLNRITNIVKSLLNFCWSLSPPERKINVNKVIEESLFSFESLFASDNIKIEKMFTKDSPKVIDRGLNIVFNNFIKNACQAMKQKGGVLTVISLIQDNFAVIQFIDTGTGVPSDIEDKIFEPFFTTKSIGEGAGLGLAISKQIVKNYNGEIYVDKKEEGGTAFTLRIPF